MLARLFALADLHLGKAVDKPMDVFGDQWRDHPKRIAAAWDQMVGPEDMVLINGDISWAMRLDEARPDLDYLAERKGSKVLLRGNHDYWWPSISKLRKELPQGMFALQNDSLVWKGLGIAGTRGWTCPGGNSFDADQDERIYEREVGRLRLSLSSLPDTAKRRVVMLHFPPTNEKLEASGFTKLIEEHNVDICVFGHLHGEHGGRRHLDGLRNGVRYVFDASDAVGFKPVLLLEVAG